MAELRSCLENHQHHKTLLGSPVILRLWAPATLTGACSARVSWGNDLPTRTACWGPALIFH